MITELSIELEGKHYVCQKRGWRSVHAPADSPPETQYSFDRGDTWHLTMIEAFSHAKESGTLMALGSEAADGEQGYETFVLQLLVEIKTLRPGESLRVVMAEKELVVVKEQAVLAVRASTVTDINLSIGEKDGR